MSPMASSPFLLSFFFIFLFINPSHQRNSYSSSSSSSSSNSSSYYPKHSFSPQKIPQIHFACKATRYPNSCETFLSKSNLLPQDPTSKRIIQSAISVSIDHLKTAQSMVKSILDTSSDNKNRSNVAASCLLILDLSQRRYESAADVLPRGKIKDARAWTSAALSYQSGCRSSLKNVKGTKLVAETMSFLDTLIELTSNALSMMMSLDNFGEDLREWRAPKTERIGFWERGRSSGISKLGFKGGLPSKLTSDVTVCKDGSCKYKTVQDAVNAAPDNVATRRFVIHIKSGVYEEIVRVPFEKKNVVLLGEGMGKTVITGSLNVGQPEMTTYNSATVGVVGDGFMASGLTIKNSAGPDAHQAVAFRSDSDLSIIQNCEFLGYQDTLYAHSLRQFYKNCRILGNVDFIFGNAAAIFKDCLILVVPRQVGPEKGENNAVTAHGRTDPAQSTGFVFENCVINGTDGYMKLYHSNPVVHKNYLGRPWKEYARTVFIHCTLEVLINPDGWMPWSGDLALKTLYYGEFHNAGPGSNVSKRVSWSNQIPEEHVSTYSVHNFIQGDNWISKSS